MDEYTRKEISSITGVSSSSVQVWTDRGVIVPHIENPVGKGTTRLYSSENAIEILIIKELQKFGIPLNLIKSILLHKEEEIIKKWKIAYEKYKPDYPEIFLIIHNSENENDIQCSVFEMPPKEFELKLNMKNYDNALILRITEILKKTNS